MSKVRALIKKLTTKDSANDTSCSYSLSKVEDLNYNRKEDNQADYMPETSEYKLNSPNNLHSNLEHELTMLFYKFSYFDFKFIKSRIDFSDIKEEDLCFINSCTIKFNSEYYKDYTVSKVVYNGMQLMPPSYMISYKEDGSIDTLNSKRLPCFVHWVDLYGMATFECRYPVYTLLQLAQLNPFFCNMNQNELQEIFTKKLKEKNII